MKRVEQACSKIDKFQASIKRQLKNQVFQVWLSK